MFTRSYLCPGLILRIMQSYRETENSTDDAYLHALYGLFLTLNSTIRCKRYYICHFLILRLIKSVCKKKRSDSAYSNALVQFLNAWSRTIRCKRSYICLGFIFRRMHSNCKKQMSSDGA